MLDNYSILANYIVDEYIDRISGNDIENFLIGEDPAKRVMVGTLAENRVSQSLKSGYVENAETKFESVPSITISFLLAKNSKGKLNVIPSGFLFYNVRPTYEQVVDYFLELYSRIDGIEYGSITELIAKHEDQKVKLPEVYKKIDISKTMGNGVEIDVESISVGKLDLEPDITLKLNALIESILGEIAIVPEMRISFKDLENEKKFNAVSAKKNSAVCPSWCIDVRCNVFDDGDNYQISLQMVNNTQTNEGKVQGYSPRIFNAGIKIVGSEDVKFQEIELDSFKTTYKKHESIYAVTENTSYYFCSENNSICTQNVPVYIQNRIKTQDQYNGYITFENLIKDPVEKLKIILNEMKKDYELCEETSEHLSLNDICQKKINKDLESYKQEINRFESGIRQIEYKDNVRKAFIYLNETFGLNVKDGKKGIVGWRLFQIVFIVSMINEIIRSEYKDDKTIAEADLDIANLLYFPTGGGKTEAFLGCCVFAMFFDRIRGKEHGLTAILKYPLRLLAVQQLDRVLTIVMKSNIIKSQKNEIKDLNDFSVGFYVGKANTPNKISAKERLSSRAEYQKNSDQLGFILESDQDTLNEYYRFIDTCPVCGEKHINVRFNYDTWKLEHICDNPKCKVRELPLLIVDSEIYRYLPSIVVSTIDKMAMIGTTNEFKMLLGQVKSFCPKHGFSCTSMCTVSREGCKEVVADVEELKDPIPTLFIQDEMHLVKESLGTFDAHYESFVNYYAKTLAPERQRKQIRFIGATATISMYEEHIRHLYHMQGRRFPCVYPSTENGRDFYSYTDIMDTTRIIMGYAPYGRSITDAMWQSIYLMRVIIYSLMSEPDKHYVKIKDRGFEGSVDDFKESLYDYWLELVYNNRKDDVTEIENALQNQGNNFLLEQGVPRFKTQQMTSDVDFQTVRKTLFDIQENRRNLESINTLLATSTISHGVDEDSFNIMYFFGMPNNNAEYIQAYSRTGRKYTGIVIDIIRLMRVRDRSYLKNFVLFHQNKDELIEAVPINRWARNAIYSTLPGLLEGILIQYYSIKNNVDSMYKALDAKKLLNSGKINVEEVADHIKGIYACNVQEKTSLAYAEIIDSEIRIILDGIAADNFSNDDTLSDAISKYSHGRKRPMTSLRDTEEQIEVQL